MSKMDRNPAHTIFLFHLCKDKPFTIYTNDNNKIRNILDQTETYLKDEKFFKIQEDVQALINRRRR